MFNCVPEERRPALKNQGDARPDFKINGDGFGGWKSKHSDEAHTSISSFAYSGTDSSVLPAMLLFFLKFYGKRKKIIETFFSYL